MPVRTADLGQAAKLVLLAPTSWSVPTGALLSVARTLNRLHVWRGPPLDNSEANIAGVLADHLTPRQASGVFRSYLDRTLESTLQILALNRPFRHWRPVLRWHGLEHVRAALAQGSGAILWVSDFVYSSLVTKIAFHDSGFGVHHLSRPNHGFSMTPFGIRYLNPIWTRVEDRFLAERVTIRNDDASGALKTLRACLDRNEVVSITVSDTAKRTVTTQFFGGAIRIATGPAHLARSSGAKLLPVFTLCDDDGTYDIWVEPPLDVDDTTENDYAVAVRRYVALLEPHILRHADQWHGWSDVTVPDGGSRPPG
jgi:lauroyl/myristoyl acyltransferase